MINEISTFARTLRTYWSEQLEILRTPAPEVQELLLEILPTIFWASLETEEGRPLSYSLAIHDGTGDYGEDISEWLFERTRPFNVQELRRLAPAVDSLQTFIVIDRNPVGGEPEMVGLLGIGRVYSEAIRASNPSLP